MSRFRFLSLLSIAYIALPFLALSQSGTHVGMYANDANPTGFVRLLVEEGCPSANPCIGTTMNLTGLQVWNFGNMVTGTVSTNQQFTMAAGTLTYSALGIVDADYVGHALVPTGCLLAATNSAGAVTCVTPTANGCVQVANNQINVSCSVDPPILFANLPTCNLAERGVRYLMTDTNIGSVSFHGNVASGGGAAYEPIECIYTGTVYQWVYV